MTVSTSSLISFGFCLFAIESSKDELTISQLPSSFFDSPIIPNRFSASGTFPIHRTKASGPDGSDRAGIISGRVSTRLDTESIIVSVAAVTK